MVRSARIDQVEWPTLMSYVDIIERKEQTVANKEGEIKWRTMT
jgi:hypothetical protein